MEAIGCRPDILQLFENMCGPVHERQCIAVLMQVKTGQQPQLQQAPVTSPTASDDTASSSQVMNDSLMVMACGCSGRCKFTLR